MEAWFPLVVSMWVHLDKCQLSSSTDFPSPYESATATWKILLPYIQCATPLHPLPHEYRYNNEFYCILCHMNIDITTSIMVTLWLHIWVWFGFDGSFEILILREYGSGIIIVRPSDGDLMAIIKPLVFDGNWNRFGRCQACDNWNFQSLSVVVKHMTIETFDRFWSSTIQSASWWL